MLFYMRVTATCFICYTTHYGLVFVTMAHLAHCFMLHSGQCVAMYIDGRIHDV